MWRRSLSKRLLKKILSINLRRDMSLNHINNFAEFEKAKNKKFLEIGVGLGADHQKFVEAGAESYGIDS